MRHLVRAAVLVGVMTAVAGVRAADGPQRFSARLSSYNEVPANSSGAAGSASIAIDDDTQTIHYHVSFSGLEGTVTQSHIHFAQEGANGGIMLWLCGTATNPGPAGTPVCPAEGDVTGMLGPADVVGPSGQGIAAGEFEEAAAAIRAGRAYANVHSTKTPGGEIRGQLTPGGGHQ